MKNLIPIFLFLLFTCCSSKPKEETSTNNDTSTTKSLPILNLAEVIDKQVPDTFTWNSLAQKTTLIPLETTGRHSLLGSSPHVQFIGNDLLVVAEFQTNTLYLYDGKGKLKHSFRHVGNGPGEYTYLSSIFFIPEDSTFQIFDNGNKKRIFYNWKGELIQDVSTKGREINFVMLIKNNKMIGRGNPDGSAQLYITDNNLENIQPICSFDSSFTPRQKAAIHLTSARTVNKDLYLLNRAMDDSVFSITDKGKEPYFILNKGKYKLPADEVPNFMKLPKDHPYITSLTFGILPEYYYITYNWHNKFWGEIWSRKTNQILSRIELTRNNQYENMRGIPYILPSGKKVKLFPNFISGNTIAFFIPAEEIAGEIPGVKEDDNPVLLVIEV